MENLLLESVWEIVEKSAFLDERLGDDFLPDTRAGNCEEIDNRIAAWRKNCAKGDEAVFRKRLQWDGLDEGRARALLGLVHKVIRETPPWARWLRPMIEASQGPCDERKNELAKIRADEPVGFEELFYPFLRLARGTLQEDSGTAYSLLADAAHRQWERSLLLSLDEIAAETLDLEFTDFRVDARSLDGTGSRDLYESFLRSLEGEGLLHLFQKYPVLARYLATRLCQWVDAAREFLVRLEADQRELEIYLNEGQSLGCVIELGPGLSDRHREGRTVLRVHFAAGLKLIYKPKMIAAEAGYWDLLGWVNRNGDQPPMRTLRVLARGDYGWVEEVAPFPCQNPCDVEAFYYRAGMLVCLVYALEGCDCHAENLIAAGDQPVLIDHETLFQPRFEFQAEQGALSLADRFFYEDSVFRTLLLPRWEIRPTGESYDISGLGGTEAHRTHRRRKIWENINTDSMRLQWEPVSIKPAGNVAILDGMKMQAAAYAGQIAAGFEQMYGFFRARDRELLGPQGRLRNWGFLRYIFRATAIYGSMQKRLYSPRCLRDGIEASIELELFTRLLLYHGERPASWPILADERRSLVQGDIPSFYYTAESDGVFFEGGGSIPGFFRESGWSRVERRFGTLNDDDLDRQLGFLRASFETVQGGRDTVERTAPGPCPGPGEDETGPDDFLAEALRIAHEILSAARPFQEGVSWNTVAYHSKAHRWQLEPMAPRLYDGLGGVAVFLAAAQRLACEPELRALARSTLATVVREAMLPAYTLRLFSPGIGAGLGQSSVIYTLVRASEFLGEEEWLRHAHSFASLLHAERIASDGSFDLLSGAAGAVLALLALYEATRLPETLRQATVCGEHLLQHRSESRLGLRAWKTFKEEMLTGFSHGAAGIAYALLKLHEATGESSFREAALEAEAYETSVFLSEASNWPDFRQSPGQTGYAHASAWCHGAAGIALSRMAALPIRDSAQIREDIAHGLRATQLAGAQGMDTVCCGAMGRAEVFLVAARKLGDPTYHQQAQQIASSVLRRSRREGTYETGWKKAPYLASFHQGMAGIGYEFLRLAAPDSLPSLLLWQ